MYDVLIFGTGNGWEKIKSYLNYNNCKIIAFIDNDPFKSGRTIDGCKIISPAEIINFKYDCIMIASQFFDEITNQLLELGVEKDKIFPYYSPASIFRYKWDLFSNNQEDHFQGQLEGFKCELSHKFNTGDLNDAEFMIERYDSITHCSMESLFLKLYLSLEFKDYGKTKELTSKCLEKLGISLKQEFFTELKMQHEMKESLISVIIPVYQDLNGLKDTLISLHSQTLDQRFYEVIVVNDGGNVEITKLCKEFGIELVEVKPNRGSYYARNRGIEISKGEYLAFVDADIIVPEYWLENGVAALRNFDYVAGDIKIDKNKVKTVTNLFNYLYSFQVTQYIRKFHYGPTANLFVRKKVFIAAGGFDERLRSSGDWEFGDRVYRYFGFKQSFSKDITIIHPPRNYPELIKKFKRIRQGHRQLEQLYWNRLHSSVRKLNVLESILNPPTDLNNICKNIDSFFKITTGNKLKIFFGFWWLKIIKSYYENF